MIITMKTIIFGKIGSGKSTIGRRIAADRNVPYENVDDYVAEWYRQEKNQQWLHQNFGVTTKEAMRTIIQKDSSVLVLLEEQTSAYVAQRLMECFALEGFVLEFPLLKDYPEYIHYVDEVVWVTADETVRLERVLHRDKGTNAERFHFLNEKQGQDDDYRSLSTHIIVNDGTWDIQDWKKHFHINDVLTHGIG